MGVLKFRVAAKQRILFTPFSIQFVRGFLSEKNLDIQFSGASGQQLIANEILYTHLTPVDDGYIQIRSANNVTISGSGILSLKMIHKPSTTQSNQLVDFYYDNGAISINVSYNSKPIANDIIRDINNRSNYVFSLTDFTSAYTDFDFDTLKEISIFGNVTGFEYNTAPYNEGEWIPVTNINAGLLQYNALSQDAYYETNNTWKAKDNVDNISD